MMMKSLALTLLLLVGAYSTCNEIGQMVSPLNPSSASVNVFFVSYSGSQATMAISVQNNKGPVNSLNSQLSDISYAILPDGFPITGAVGSIADIAGLSRGDSAFSVKKQYVNNNQVLAVVHYRQNGKSNQWIGCFNLSSSALASRDAQEDFQAQSLQAREFTDNTIDVTTDQWQSKDNKQLWVTLQLYSAVATNTIYWYVTDPTNRCTNIAYPTSGRPVSMASNTFKNVQVSMQCSYDANNASFNLPVSVTYRAGNGPVTTLSGTVTMITYCATCNPSKRSSEYEADEADKATHLRADYAIGIASAGVLVAAVAIVAAVVTIRRRSASTQFSQL